MTVRQPDYGIYREDAASPCHACGYLTDAASEVTSRGRPSADDFALCLRCGALAVFTGQGLLKRTPTDEELAEFAEDEKMVAVQLRIKQDKPLG